MTKKRDKTSRPLWAMDIMNIIMVTIAVLSLLAFIRPPSVQSAPLLFVEEAMIVTQQLLSGVCTDYLGAERGDLEEWTSTSGACDRIVCHVEPSGNYTITHSCRPREPSENPDTDNCQWISNSTQAYPDCCPQLSCGEASTLTTIDPLSCYDLATSFACSVWYNLTSGCNDTTVDVYNISHVFCQQTCSLC